jgi:site-specific recombinase XerD
MGTQPNRQNRSYTMKPQEHSRFNELYEEHLKCLKLQGKAKKTVDVYSRAVRRIVEQTGKSPEKLTKADLRTYFADLLESHSWSTIKVDRNGLQFFWKHVLQRDWDWIEIVKPPEIRSLPDILSVDEVRVIIDAVQKPRYRVCLFTIYSMGLRLGEGVKLGIGDIDSNRMLVHIRKGKGKKDRYVPLPHSTLLALRCYWKQHRNPNLMFPNCSNKYRSLSEAKTPMDHGAMQRAFKDAVRMCNIKKSVSVHSLRHSYATHLLEAGVNLRLIQDYLGHTSPMTTARYTHMTKVSQENAEEILNGLMDRFLPVRWQ